MTTFTMASIHNAYTSITTTHTTEVIMTYTHNVANEIALLEALVADDLPVMTAQDWAEAVADVVGEAQDAYGRVLRAMAHAKYNPLNVNLTSYVEDEVNLTLIIEELEGMGLTNISEPCLALHSQMLVVFEGVLIAQEQINKLEHHEDIVDAKEYARTVCTAAKKELKRINNNYDNACQDYLFDLADELDQAINEAKQYNLTDVVEYCTKLHCLLISTYEGVVMHQEA